jgi:hypothetical protein
MTYVKSLKGLFFTILYALEATSTFTILATPPPVVLKQHYCSATTRKLCCKMTLALGAGAGVCVCVAPISEDLIGEDIIDNRELNRGLLNT